MTFDSIRGYELMYLIRHVDEEIARHYDQGPEGKIKTPVHLSIGQEAVAVGVTMALPEDTHVFASHRNHAAYLAKGGDLDTMIAEIYGKATGCCGGRGGSMHLVDESVGFMGGYPIVGDAISLAVGSALAAKLEGSDRMTAVFFGDGAVESGQFWESLNFAERHRLSILFVCENNRLATQTFVEQRQPMSPAIATRVGSAIRSGNIYDNYPGYVERIYNMITGTLASPIHAGTPAFVEIETNRQMEHVGPNPSQESSMSPWSTKEWRDPLKALRDSIDKAPAAVIEANTQKRVREAFERAEAAPWPEAAA